MRKTLELVLSGLRAGRTVTDIALDLNCTRAWIYFLLKQAGLNSKDFRWYQRKDLTAGTKRVASLLASKHLKVRVTLGRRSLITVLEEGRTPIKLAVHTVTKAAATSNRSRTLYHRINIRRKGVVHIVPLDWETLVIARHAPEGLCVPASRAGTRKRNFIPIGQLLDVDILDVLRENVRV